MASSKIKAAFFHNECAPYRIPLFQKISELPCVDLYLYFGKYSSSYRKWKTRMNVSFKYEILKEIPGLERFLGAENPLNPSLFFKLVLSKNDVYIAGAPFYVGSIITFFAAKILRKPYILFLEDVDHPVSFHRSRVDSFLKLSFSRKLHELVMFIIRSSFSQIVLRYSDAYVAPGTATKEYLLRRNVVASKIFVAVNAVDNEYLKEECERLIKSKAPEKLKNKLGLKEEKIVLFVGYFREIKGAQFLIKACSMLEDLKYNIKLILVGSGEYEDELRRVSETSNLEVLFAGHQYGSDLVSYYLIADVFVLPTLQDVWGFVINEAMVCGCPVITTKNAGASRDLVKDGVNGYVVEPSISSHLFRALKKILDDPQKARAMGEASKDIIKGYSYGKSVRGFESAINYATLCEICGKYNE
jgi:glycosyltransferase involved in cell wall biosynthesis